MRGSQPKRFVDVFGKSLSIPELATICGLTAHVVRLRLRIGWSVERIIQTPLKMQSRPVQPGDVFDFLTVDRPGPAGHRGKARWYCKCRCGAVDVLVREYSLTVETATSCGCSTKRQDDLTGRPLNESGSLILARVSHSGTAGGLRGSRWQCRCACGNLFEDRGDKLLRGKRAWCSLDCPKRVEHKRVLGKNVGRANANRHKRVNGGAGER